MNRKILVPELWGLGDLTFSAVFLQSALQAGDEVRLLDNSHARTPLEPSYPHPRGPLVVAVVATYRRPRELARLLESLKESTVPVAVVVVDNAGDLATEEAIEASRGAMQVERVVPGRNLGCGGGLAAGERYAMEHFGSRMTHLFIVDDDAVMTPAVLEQLLAAMEKEGAFIACPMVVDSAGEIGWFPGLLDRPVFDAVRKKTVPTQAAYLQKFGPKPVPFSWSTGVSLLVKREAMEGAGLHRSDFLIRGEDLDFSLRMTRWGKGIFVPEAVVEHLPPPATPASEERWKHAVLLQNLAFISIRLPYGRRILSTLPGNFLRFVRTWGVGSLWEGLHAYWKGAVIGHPAGHGMLEPEKVVVFAHTPPPHHGQSYMVQLMLEGFATDLEASAPDSARKIAAFHVNCQVSKDMEDIGAMRYGKLVRLLGYCFQAIRHRVCDGVRTLYYIPAPGKRCALYRDWIVMAICRPFFQNVIFHWHASGVTDWLEKEGYPLERLLTRWLLGRPQLSIALAQAGSQDAAWLQSRKVTIVPNGIPDPCPDFEREVLPCRLARLKERLSAPEEVSDTGPVVFRLLYIAHCTRDKGLFDTLEGVSLFNSRSTRYRAHLTVAGSFMSPAEEQEFQNRIRQPDLARAVIYIGFATGKLKEQLFKESDCLCFPSYYKAESFGLVIVEAMAYGMPCVTTRWRAIPELLPPDYQGYVNIQAPTEIAEKLESLVTLDLFETLRARFLTQFSLSRHLQMLAEALVSAKT